ncbi:CD1247 N-terminal domain-containing protein [Ruminococcus sp.]|uniref:CD1247 N-terminal domain-containing protein n=1 Tax=Ruminococcus sp. TaxID=41978 RepID=UPI0025FA652C|nr:CD1247 N-terminal domain-containing protein [Ruminococcus sp.]
MELSKKVAYLKGLMDGLKIDDSTNEGKILYAMADILDEMAATVEDVADEVDEAVELLDTLDEDLGELEDDFYCDDDDCDCDDDCCCDDDDEDYEDDDDAMYECVCPNCGDTIMLGENIIAEGSIDCPNCGESLEFDFSEIDDEEDED